MKGTVALKKDAKVPFFGFLGRIFSGNRLPAAVIDQLTVINQQLNKRNLSK